MVTGDSKPRPVLLNATQAKYLHGFAKTRSFWDGILRGSVDGDGKITLWPKQLDMLKADIEKYPSLVDGEPVRNRAGKDGIVRCWRRDCKNPASTVVASIGVCGSCVEAQTADNEAYKRRKVLSAALDQQMGEDDA